MSVDNPFAILVVDDEPPIADLLARLARNLFPEAVITNARSAQETLDLLNQQPDHWPQLILLDIDLHQAVNGLDLLPQLQNRFQGHIPIVMLTTSTDQTDRQRAAAAGAVAFTQKPDGLQEWKAYIHQLRTTWYQ